MSAVLGLRRTALRHAFLVVHPEVERSLRAGRRDEVLVVRIESLNSSSASSSVLASVVSDPSLSSSEAAVDAAWSLAHGGLAEVESVVVRAWPDTPPALARVWIRPESEDDREIIELNADRLQTTLLNQARLVQLNGSVVIHVDNVSAVATVVRVDPECSFGLLHAMSEIHVDAANNNNRSSSVDHNGGNEKSQTLLSRLKSLLSPQSASAGATEVNLDLPLLVRVAPNNSSQQHLFCAFLLPNVFHPDADVVVGLRRQDRVVALKMHVRGHGDFLPASAPPPTTPTLLLSSRLMTSLELTLGDSVRLEKVDFSVGKNVRMNVATDEELSATEKTQLLSSLSSSCPIPPVIIPSDISIRISANCSVFCSGNAPFVFDSPADSDVGRIDFTRRSNDGTQETVNEEEEEPKATSTMLDGVSECASRLLLSLRARSSMSVSPVLLVGGAGAGKSTAFKQIAAECRRNNVYAQVFACRRMIGRKPELVSKAISEALATCASRWPSALLVDDVDAVCKVANANNDNQAESNFNLGLSLCVRSALSSARPLFIPVLASSSSASDLHEAVAPARGVHFFGNTIKIGHPNATQRLSMLTSLLTASSTRSLLSDCDEFSTLTEGFAPVDIVRLAETINVKHMQGELSSSSDFSSAVRSCLPLSLWHARLQSASSSPSWSSVGGLNAAKTALIETAAWPSRYPRLFAQCGLRPRTGVLLYGMPGTGKTRLAAALAGKAGCKLIAVKGPELLSKYIGASEAAVRDVFARAVAAKPCILFFDEFDSLAPRRGHDSTGVTDRVVNQLLTQMDGVESLEGVVVVAATSRPDLIDPALLRPGRIDKKVLCPMPDENDRLDILRALSRDVNIASSVSSNCLADIDDGNEGSSTSNHNTMLPSCDSRDEALRSLAAATEGFTGADLQAVLYSAQLDAIKNSRDGKILNSVKDTVIDVTEVTEESASTFVFSSKSGKWTPVAETENAETKAGQKLSTSSPSPSPSLTSSMLLKAARETRPSVTPAEVSRFTAIYAAFQGSTATGTRPKRPPMEQRATLA